MKTKIIQNVKAFLLMLVTVLIAINVFAQGNTWKLGGNNNVGSFDFIGSTNNADFRIFTNNQLRINVGKDGTTIRYFIPDEVKNAAIIFHNDFGQELKTVEISEKGMGQINLTTTNLTSGIYTYSLLVDGKLVETKRMMKVE